MFIVQDGRHKKLYKTFYFVWQVTLINIKKIIGPRIVPCGTPGVTCDQFEYDPRTTSDHNSLLPISEKTSKPL